MSGGQQAVQYVQGSRRVEGSRKEKKRSAGSRSAMPIQEV